MGNWGKIHRRDLRLVASPQVRVGWDETGASCSMPLAQNSPVVTANGE